MLIDLSFLGRGSVNCPSNSKQILLLALSNLKLVIWKVALGIKSADRKISSSFFGQAPISKIFLITPISDNSISRTYSSFMEGLKKIVPQLSFMENSASFRVNGPLSIEISYKLIYFSGALSSQPENIKIKARLSSATIFFRSAETDRYQSLLFFVFFTVLFLVLH